MNDFTRIAVKRTMDPMQVVMNCLFEKKGDVFISNKILEIIKKAHSYTMSTQGKEDVYTFHKRIRGTDTLFSFLVTKRPEGNRVSNLDCITADFGVLYNHENGTDADWRKLKPLYIQPPPVWGK